MNTQELASLFRADVDDLAQPYLWSVEEVVGYMDDAQKMFCRLTGGIRDATSGMCSLDMSAGDTFVETDPRILRIARIQRDSDGVELDIINLSDLADRDIRLDATTGHVTAVVIGIGAHTLRWVRIPTQADTASLVVERLPMLTLSATRTTNLEIDPQHHRHLMLWMASLAYAKQDADTRDEQKAAHKEAQFRTYCAEAKAEKFRSQHKARSVRYGGI